MAKPWRKVITRREFLGGALAVGTGAVAAACAPSQPAQQAPAVQGRPTQLLVLWQSSFVQEQDKLLDQMAQDWGKKNNVEVRVEHIAYNDTPARIAAAIQAGSGPDVIRWTQGWAWIYENSLVDVSKEVEELIKRLGGIYPDAEAYNKVNRVWRAVPWSVNPGAFVYRTDYFREAGVQPPTTWDDFIQVGKKLKAYGKPIGQALGHSYGDPPGFWYPWLWAWGGKEVLEDGKTVALESDATLLAVEKAVELFYGALDESGLSWDDTSNNRAYLAEQLSCTLNGASIYFVAKRDFPKVAEVSDHFVHPRGPAGQLSLHALFSLGIMSYSKNVQAAKDLIMYLMDPQQYSKWVDVGLAYEFAPFKYSENDPVWNKDPKIKAFRDVVVNGSGRWPGWPGPPTAKAAQVREAYIIVDLFAKACSREFKPADAVKWAAGQLRQIYGRS